MKEHLKRIIIDIKDIIDDPIDGIIYKPDEENIMRGLFSFMVPKIHHINLGTTFFNLNSQSRIHINHPLSHITQIMDECDSIPILPKWKSVFVILNTWEGDQWSACQSVRSVLLTLQMRLNENPLLNEPGVHEIRHKYHIELYNEIITYENINLCICDYVIDIANLPNQFKIFYNDVCNHISLSENTRRNVSVNRN